MSSIVNYADANRVRAEVFTDTGKWKYSVLLDYAETASIVHQPSGYIDVNAAARLALRTATRCGTSEVIFEQLPHGWVMFVPDPPNGWPVMVAAS